MTKEPQERLIEYVKDLLDSYDSQTSDERWEELGCKWSHDDCYSVGDIRSCIILAVRAAISKIKGE